MYRTFFVFLKCTTQDGPNVDVLLIAFLYLWRKFWEGIDKYWIVPVRKLFYFHHCVLLIIFVHKVNQRWLPIENNLASGKFVFFELELL